MLRTHLLDSRTPMHLDGMGMVSAPHIILLTNSGSGALHLDHVDVQSATPGVFGGQPGTCAQVLAAGASCQLGIDFGPMDVGTFIGKLFLYDDAQGSPQTVDLRGTGIAAAVTELTVIPASIDFGNQQVGTVSSDHTITIANTGTGVITLQGAVLTGDGANEFITGPSDCTQMLAPGASCQLPVAFFPQSAGNWSADLVINSDASNGPQSVAFHGIAGAQQATLALSTDLITFGGKQVGTTSAYQTVTITNTGTTDVSVQSIRLTGPNAASFTLGESDCTASLAAGASCHVQVAFSPTTTGDLSADLAFTDAASGSPQIVTLTGSGLPNG